MKETFQLQPPTAGLLAPCLQQSAKTDALSDFHHQGRKTGTKSRWVQRAEPKPAWGVLGTGALCDITKRLLTELHVPAWTLLPPGGVHPPCGDAAGVSSASCGSCKTLC